MYSPPMHSYTVHRASSSPADLLNFDAPFWEPAQILKIDHFYPQSSDHRPVVRAKLLHDEQNIYIVFDVQDQFVRVVAKGYQSAVCRDACVEFFVRPKPDKAYLNFETSGGGAMLCYFIENHERTDGGFKKFAKVTDQWLDQIKVLHTLPPRVEPEIAEPTHWSLAYAIPRTLIEAHVGPLGTLAGQTWRANFFKCADDCSHPHWASWSPIEGKLNFHVPQYFGQITFA